jgi:hypothetical protein
MLTKILINHKKCTQTISFLIAIFRYKFFLIKQNKACKHDPREKFFTVYIKQKILPLKQSITLPRAIFLDKIHHNYLKIINFIFLITFHD